MACRKVALFLVLAAAVAALLGEISSTDFCVAALLGLYVLARERLHLWRLDRRTRR